jgi:hypothetical protein
MGVGLRPEAEMEGPAIAGNGFKGLPVEQHFRFVGVRHRVDFLSVMRVEEDRFEGKRAVGNPVRCLERFDWTAASSIYWKDGAEGHAAAPNLKVY